MEPVCGATAKWAIAPYGDPDHAAVSCDAHIVQFLEAAVDGRVARGTDGFSVYPIPPATRGTVCRHRVAEAAPKI